MKEEKADFLLHMILLGTVVTVVVFYLWPRYVAEQNAVRAYQHDFNRETELRDEDQETTGQGETPPPPEPHNP